jgi:hypothetical protein
MMELFERGMLAGGDLLSIESSRRMYYSRFKWDGT